MKISLGYPDKNHEVAILKNNEIIKSTNGIHPVATEEDIHTMQTESDKLLVHEDILNYIVDISNETRNCKDLKLGASPRASIDLLKVSKARAYLYGRDYVIPDDVKDMIFPVFNHRLKLSSEARIEKKSIQEILQEVLNRVKVPVK